VLEGNDPNDFNFSYTRQTLSPGYNKWLAEHTKEIKSAKYIPQFITNNVNLIQEITEIKPKQKLVAKAAKATKTVEQSTSLESIVKSDAPKEPKVTISDYIDDLEYADKYKYIAASIEPKINEIA